MLKQEQHTFRMKILTGMFFLCFIHTIPVIWYAVIAAGTAPAFILFLFALYGLSFITQISLGLIYLLPVLFIYSLIIYFLARFSRWIICRIPSLTAQMILASTFILLLFYISITQPIYISGGHNSSSYSNAYEILNSLSKQFPPLRYYYHILAAVFIILILLASSAELKNAMGRLLRPVFGNSIVKIIMIALISIPFIYGNRVLFVYKPLAEINFTWAQIQIGHQLKSNKKNKLWGNQNPAYWYQRAASNGNAEAAMIMYKQAGGLTKRLRWLEIAAAQEHAEAQYLLYQLLLRNKPDTDTIDRAYTILEQAALNEYGAAQYTLASIYASSSKTQPARYQKDLKKSLHWYRRAAKNKYEPAVRLVAVGYANGTHGFPIDKRRARDLYKSIGEHDRARAVEIRLINLKNLDIRTLKQEAMKLLEASNGSAQNRQQAITYLQQAAELDDADAAYRLGEIFAFGRYQFDKDLVKAHRWWQLASDSGQRKAMERIANGTLNGSFGYQTDLIEALKQVRRLVEAYQYEVKDSKRSAQKYHYWKKYIRYIKEQMQRSGTDYQSPSKLKQKADNNDVTAQFTLARQMLETGNYKEKEPGLQLMMQAADSGHAEARYLLASRYAYGFKLYERHPEKTRNYLIQAAAANHPRAMSQLAMAYEKGNHGFKQDHVKARKLFVDTVALLDPEPGDDLPTKMFLRLNKSRIAVIDRMLKYKREWQDRYDTSSPYEKKVMEIHKKYSKIYQDRVNAICRNNPYCTDKQRRQEDDRVRTQTNLERDQEIKRLQSN